LTGSFGIFTKQPLSNFLSAALNEVVFILLKTDLLTAMAGLEARQACYEIRSSVDSTWLSLLPKHDWVQYNTIDYNARFKEHIENVKCTSKQLKNIR